MDHTDNNDNEEDPSMILEAFGHEESHCWRIYTFKSSAPPESQLWYFHTVTVNTSLNLHLTNPQKLINLYAGKYFQHYQNLKHLTFAPNNT